MTEEEEEWILGRYILSDASHPEEEVVFFDNHYQDLFSSFEYTQTITNNPTVGRLSTPTLSPTKRTKNRNMPKPRKSNCDGEEDVVSDDSSDVNELRAELLNYSKLSHPQLPVTDHEYDKGPRKANEFRWLWRVLAALLLLFFVCTAGISVYRDSISLPLGRTLRFLLAIPHAQTYKKRMELAERELWKAISDVSRLQSKLQAAQQQSDNDQKKYQTMQAKLRKMESKLEIAMETIRSSEQVMSSLRKELKQAQSAQKTAESQLEEHQNQKSELLQLYHSERKLRKIMEQEEVHAIVRGKEYHDALHQAQMQLEHALSEPQYLLTCRMWKEKKENDLEEENPNEEVKMMESQRQIQMDQELNIDVHQLRQQQQRELRLGINLMRFKRKALMMGDLQCSMQKEEPSINIEGRAVEDKHSQPIDMRTSESLSDRDQTRDSMESASTPAKNILEAVNIQFERVQDRVVTANTSTATVEVQPPGSTIITAKFREGESPFAFPTVLERAKDTLPQLVNTTQSVLVRAWLHICALGLTRDIGKTAITGFNRVILCTKAAASDVVAVASKAVDLRKSLLEHRHVQGFIRSNSVKSTSHGVRNAKIRIREGLVSASKSMLDMQVQSTEAAFLKLSYKDWEPLVVIPTAMNAGESIFTTVVALTAILMNRITLSLRNVLKLGASSARKASGTVQESFNNILAGRQAQFRRAEESIAARTERLGHLTLEATKILWGDVEEILDGIAVTGASKMDRGKDSLTSLGLLAANRITRWNREVVHLAHDCRETKTTQLNEVLTWWTSTTVEVAKV